MDGGGGMDEWIVKVVVLVQSLMLMSIFSLERRFYELTGLSSSIFSLGRFGICMCMVRLHSGKGMRLRPILTVMHGRARDAPHNTCRATFHRKAQKMFTWTRRLWVRVRA